MSGARVNAVAMLVIGPSGHSVTVPGGLGAQSLDQEIDAVPVLQRHRRLGQVGPVQPGLAVDMLRGDQLAMQRRGAAGEDRNISSARQLH